MRWAVRGFEEPVAAAGSLDAAVCVGNSLSLAADLPAVGRALGQMFAAVRRGGLVVVQVLNLWRLPDGPCVWQKCQAAALPQGEVLILKGVHRAAGRGFVELLVARPAGGPLLAADSVPFLGLEAAELETLARQAGAAAAVHFFGGYQEQPYDRQQSVDLVMVAER